MLEDLPNLQDVEYLISNIVAHFKLTDDMPLYIALLNTHISCKEVKKGETWNRNGVDLKYVQFTFLVDKMHEKLIIDSLSDILTACKSALHQDGYIHVHWKPIINIRAFDINEHLYKNKKFISRTGCYYRSRSEVKIAKTLDELGISFLANARGRFKNNSLTKTIEPDFIVFLAGKFAVLEVDGEGFHDDSEYEKERDSILLKNGSLFVEHYSASLCYINPHAVVKDFISKFENSLNRVLASSLNNPPSVSTCQ